MKKILFIIIFIFFIFSVANAQELTNYAKGAIIIENTTNKILYEKDKDTQLAPASMTKIMTMLLIMEALDNGQIKLSDMVPVSKNSSAMGGSSIFLQEGMEISVESLLKGIAIASGNDAAVAMAEYIGGTQENFVDMMNEKVEKLGLKNTHFVNVHGLDAEDHYSSAYDMSQMARELLKHEDILKFTSVYEEYMDKPDGTKIWLVNTNKLVRFYNGVDGLKTGFTDKAGYCLTATAMKNGVRYITVTMGEDTTEHRSADTTSMLNYAFSNYKLNNVLTKNTKIKEINIKKGQKNKAIVVVKEDINDLISSMDKKTYSYEIEITKDEAPLKKDEAIGILKVLDNNNQVIKSVDLVLIEDIPKANFINVFIKNMKLLVNGYNV